jgi:hypothetical protein
MPPSYRGGILISVTLRSRVRAATHEKHFQRLFKRIARPATASSEAMARLGAYRCGENRKRVLLEEETAN